MCRAIRVLVISDNDPRRQEIRAAVGVEAEVVAAIGTSEPVAVEVDVAIVDGDDAGAGTALEALASSQPRVGLIWIGEEAPAGAHATVQAATLREDLPSAIVKALMARR